MSSFIIDKNEYVKVGAFIGAFTEMRYRGDLLIYLYNEQTNKLYTANDVINEMVNIYQLNVASVNEQYGEDNEYDDEKLDRMLVAKYMGYAKKILYDENKLEIAIANVHKFFRSVNYQIENEELNARAKEIMQKYECALLDVFMEIKGIPTDSWGSFDIAD